MAKTVAAAKAKTKAKAKVKAAAVKSKTAAKTKGKAKAENVNPYELPPDEDQARLNAFFTSTTRRPGEVPTSSHVAPVPDPEMEAAAVVDPHIHEAATNVENEQSKEGDDGIDSTLNPNDAAVQALPKEELPIPIPTVTTAEADSAHHSLATVTTGGNEAPAIGHAPGGSEDSKGQDGEILTEIANVNEHKSEKLVNHLNPDDTPDSSDESPKSNLSSEAIQDYMSRGTLNLYRGENISLSEVSQFFRGFVSCKWELDVPTLVRKILTNDEVMSLVAQGRNHVQIKEYESEIRGSKPDDLLEWSFGSDPDHAHDDLEHLIIWLVQKEKITFVSEEEARELINQQVDLESRH